MYEALVHNYRPDHEKWTQIMDQVDCGSVTHHRLIPVTACCQFFLFPHDAGFSSPWTLYSLLVRFVLITLLLLNKWAEQELRVSSRRPVIDLMVWVEEVTQQLPSEQFKHRQVCLSIENTSNNAMYQSSLYIQVSMSHCRICAHIYLLLKILKIITHRNCNIKRKKVLGHINMLWRFVVPNQGLDCSKWTQFKSEGSWVDMREKIIENYVKFGGWSPGLSWSR